MRDISSVVIFCINKLSKMIPLYTVLPNILSICVTYQVQFKSYMAVNNSKFH